MKEPWFWREKGFAAEAASLLFAPAAVLYDAGQVIRAALAAPQGASAPVICIGNAVLGGVGKTPFALLLQGILKEHGVSAHFASRGYGGSIDGPTRVGAQHRAADVGDEPLLLAAAAPTWIARSRLAGVRAAAEGADVVIMDDGFQNPTVRKSVSFLIARADDPVGNGRVFPSGPLREPLKRAFSRADAVVIVGEGGSAIETGSLPVFRASTEIETSVPPQKVVAFCGIGTPGRFFHDLERRGFAIAARTAFADHHLYSDAEIRTLRRTAIRESAPLITTEKDFVRLGAEHREGVAVARLRMSADDPAALAAFTLRKAGLSK